MAKNPEAVSSFLNDLSKRLDSALEKEKKVLLDYKRQECEDLKQPFEAIIRPYDTAFFQNLVEEKQVSLDSTHVCMRMWRSYSLSHFSVCS